MRAPAFVTAIPTIESPRLVLRQSGRSFDELYFGLLRAEWPALR